MAKCSKNCYHYDVCNGRFDCEDYGCNCLDFKDKSLIVELPCRVGDDNKNAHRTCEQCIHETACQSWNIGSIHNMNAKNCINYETIKDSNAYFLGVRSVEDDAYSRGCLAGIELGKREALCEINETDAKSMICTLDMFKRLAFNIHGVIDVIDDRNIEKMREILSQTKNEFVCPTNELIASMECENNG